jgi:putative autotransporter adhesin-like protein
MKRMTTAILATAVALGAVSCKKDIIGDGPVTTQTRTTANFTAIDLQMNGNVYYTKSAVAKVEVTAKESIHGMLETNVVDNRLVIRYHNGKTYDSDESLRINVYAPQMNSLMLNTSGSIVANSDLEAASIYLRSSGSGNIYLQKVISTQLEAEASGSGQITATGGTSVVEKLKSDASGKIDLSAVAAEQVTAHTKGSGDIKVKVSGHLDATIAGSGSIYFSGYPQLSTHISGSGHLVRY